MGKLTLHGKLRDRPGSDGCLIIIHGLGGTTDAFYCIKAAKAAEELGLSTLRFALRGADRHGEDFYHGGLTADLEATIASPELARYKHIYVMGYSLGGHMTLRYGLAPTDPRVRALVAISPPLDLSKTADAVDHPRSRAYRYHILRAVNEIYRAVDDNHRLSPSANEVQAAKTMREWDGLAVATRHGFNGAEGYYSTMSVGPLLNSIQLPTFILHSNQDPMIPPSTYEHLLKGAMHNITFSGIPMGGHVAFPGRVRLGLDAKPTAEHQCIAWMLQRAA